MGEREATRSPVPRAIRGRSGTSSLGPGREFDLIRSFLAGGVASSDEVLVGPGDDATVIIGDRIVLSTDLSVEDVHFRRQWLAAEEVGYRATAAALSDLAAMAARPIGVLASLAIAERDVEPLASGVMDGVRLVVENCGGELLGGDLTRSPGPLVLDVVAVGAIGTANSPVLRSGGRAGDELWVTGHLGGAAFALRMLEEGSSEGIPTMDRFARPRPRVREAIWLAEHGVPAAMLDLSDGLGKDVGHLAAASRVRASLDSARIPVDAALRELLSPDDALWLALSGGEDYELCFASRPGLVGPLVPTFEEAFGIPLTWVGRLEAGSGVSVDREGNPPQPYHPEGFQHFGEPA